LTTSFFRGDRARIPGGLPNALRELLVLNFSLKEATMSKTIGMKGMFRLILEARFEPELIEIGESHSQMVARVGKETFVIYDKHVSSLTIITQVHTEACYGLEDFLESCDRILP
jgi:hypothetical protein